MIDTASLGNWDGDISQLCGSVGIAEGRDMER
jgi:hypothetical protein